MHHPTPPRSLHDSDKPQPADTTSPCPSLTAHQPSQARPNPQNNPRSHRMKELSPELQGCEWLREEVEEGEAGYLLKLPMSNWAMENQDDDEDDDDNEQVRRSMDLTTIKHKLKLGMYSGPNDFHQDMLLLFANALYYAQNQPSLAALLQKASTLYHRSYRHLSKLSRTNRRRTPSRSRSKPHLKVNYLENEDERVYDEAFTRADIELFGRCLSELSTRNKVALIHAFHQKHPGFRLHDPTTLALAALSACQLYDLLQLAQRFKRMDFEINYPRYRPQPAVAQEPRHLTARLLQPHSLIDYNIYSGSESSFQIENEED